ncbi:hypothetical protein Pla100_51860 [Neorhodopirellula pilleata]|uniref:Uncharacterized protein n=1 Tax=Neorhodopirellula pilleata TaxID=2714738 RepID=A0A5C5ZWC5_9BACT|nr:hypothetical protein Pla100_51860 [Neorhodopirellula pilleata]
MINVKEVRKQFKDLVLLGLKHEGYRYEAKREAIKRTATKSTSKTEWRCHFRTLTGSPIRIEPSFSIRLPSVEAVFHEGMNTPPAYRDMTSILWANVSEFLPKENQKIIFSVETTSQVEECVRSYLDWYRQFVSPYFETHSNTIAIDSVLNSDPRNPCRFQPSVIHRCGFGAITAFACRAYDDAEAIAAVYSDTMKLVDRGFHVDFFAKVVSLARKKRDEGAFEEGK